MFPQDFAKDTAMRFDTFGTDGLAGAPSAAARAERLGFSGYWAGEAGHDPLLAAGGAVAATSTLGVGTGILVAFARTPMTVAQAAWDLARTSNGRFVLGLGTQVKAHVTRRYGMPWSDPVPRMRDFVGATRAIFESYQTGSPLRYEGDYYQHTLLTPFFNPGPIDHPDVPLALAAVGTHMAELAGELFDGVFMHPFTNTAYIDTATLPSLRAGAARAARDELPWVFGYVFCIVGDTEEEQAAAELEVRKRLAFYASTPDYVDVLAAIGFEDVQPELQALVRSQEWDRLPSVLTDELLDHLAVRGTLEELPERIRSRFAGRCDRLASYLPLPEADPDRLQQFVAAVQRD